MIPPKRKTALSYCPFEDKKMADERLFWRVRGSAESVNFILSPEYGAGAAMGIMWWSHLSGAASNGKNFTVLPET